MGHSEKLSIQTMRNQGLDALKMICAFLVVCIHVRMQGTAGQYFVTLTRIAVPIFFMITGYFFQTMLDRNTLKKQVIKAAKLCLSASVFYLIFNGVVMSFQGELFQYLHDSIGIKAILRFVVFNDTPIEGHLWYLGAIVYTMVLIGCLDKRIDRKKRYWMIPVLLLGDLILGKYSLLLFDRQFNFIIVRNWLFVGVPYFLLGDWIRQISTTSEIQWLKKSHLLVLGVTFALTGFAERYFLLRVNANAMRDHYISTTLLAIVVFLLFIKLDGKVICSLSKLGKKYSSMIYILHPAVITILEMINLGKITEINWLHNLTMPIIVFGISWILSVLVELCRRNFQLRNEKVSG